MMQFIGKKYLSVVAKNILLILIIALLPVSCSKKEVKPVSEESKLVLEAIRLSETLKDAYIDKDREALEKNTTKDEFMELIGGMKTFDRADITFTPTWTEIKDSAVYLTVSWKGTWVVRGKSYEERGLGIFVFEGSPMKLAKIQRENPFRQPE